MELSEIRRQARTEFGIDETDTTFSNEVLTGLINSGLRTVTTLDRWPWMQQRATVDLVSGDSQVPAISDLSTIDSIMLTGDKAKAITYSLTKERVRFANRTGPPARYYTISNSIYILPTPDKVYTLEIDYWSDLEIPLVDNSDQPLLPDLHMNLLINQVCILMSRRTGDLDREKVFYAARQQAYQNALEYKSTSVQGFRIPKTKGPSL